MNNYQPGSGGVNRVKNPLQLADNELVEARNAEFHPDASIGGEAALTKRGGLSRLFTSALGGAVYGFIGLALEATVASSFYWFPVADISESDNGNATKTFSRVGIPVSDWDAVNDVSEDSSYIRVHYDTMGSASGPGAFFIDMDLENIADPGHDTGFTLKIRCRRSSIDTGNVLTAIMSISLQGNSAFNIVGRTITTAELTAGGSTFTEYELALSEANIQDLRADDGFANGKLRIFGEVTLTTAPGAMTETFDFDIASAWIEIEAP